MKFSCPPVIALASTQFLGALAVLLLSAPAGAQDTDYLVRVGQSGMSPNFSLQLSESWNARFGLERFEHPWGIGADQRGYSISPDSARGSAFLDWRPIASGFRVSGGLLYQGDNVDGNYDPQANGYIGSLNLDADSEQWQAAPYLGVGWDSAVQRSEPGWNLKLDAGVLFPGNAAGANTGSEAAARGLAPGFQNDTGERGSDLGRFGQYPVLSIGARYRW